MNGRRRVTPANHNGESTIDTTTPTDTMRALVLGADGPKLQTDYRRPSIASESASIRLLRAGVCSTDLELVKGYMGYRGVLGHEFVGRVEAADDAAWIGRRVVGTINLGCRRCAECVGRGAEHCPHRTVLGIMGHDGVFADYLTLPLANLLPVPDSVSDAHAVFTEPLAAALRLREQCVVSPSQSVAVVGPGRLGLLIAQVLQLAGGHVTVLGRRSESLRLPSRWGMETGLAADAADNSFDLVVEATGNGDGLETSLRLVRPLGTLALKSTFAAAPTVDLTKIVVAEITVVGSRCGPFAPALRLLERRQVQIDPLIEAEYPLAEGLQALEHAGRPGALKVLLKP